METKSTYTTGTEANHIYESSLRNLKMAVAQFGEAGGNVTETIVSGHNKTVIILEDVTSEKWRKV
jgi:hypothetical protein